MVILPPTFLYVLLVTSDSFYSLGCWPTDLIFLNNLWIWFCCGVAALVHTFQGTFVTKGTHVSSTSFGIVTAVPDSPVSYGPATKLLLLGWVQSHTKLLKNTYGRSHPLCRSSVDFTQQVFPFALKVRLRCSWLVLESEQGWDTAWACSC